MSSRNSEQRAADIPSGPRSLWDRMAEQRRKRLVWWLWLVIWFALLAGLVDRSFFTVVVILSAFHFMLILALLRFDLIAFPVQVRIAYFLWVAVGTFVPYMTILMYITIIGLATNLFLGYCPLARMLYLLPWNRQEPFSFGLIRRVMLTPPVAGKFKPKPF